MTDINQLIAKRIRTRRRLLDLTQAELGDQLGVCFQTINKYEQGAVKLSAAKLYEVAQILQVPVGYFYEGEMA